MSDSPTGATVFPLPLGTLLQAPQRCLGLQIGPSPTHAVVFFPARAHRGEFQVMNQAQEEVGKDIF